MTVRLALLLLRGSGRSGLLRLGLMSLGATLGAVTLLTVLGVPRIIAAQEGRQAARTPTSVTGNIAHPASFAVVRDRFDGRAVTRVLVSGKAAPPPGVSRLPDANEVVLSPALSELVNSQPNWRRRFPGHQETFIKPDGLAFPDELYAYIGVQPRALGSSGAPLTAYGAPTPPDVYLSTGQAHLLELALAGLTGLPLAVFLTVCFRLSAATRSRRLSALRLVGLDARRTQIVNGLESAIVAAVGLSVGVASFFPINAAIARSGLAGTTWFPADATPSWSGLLLLLIVFPFLAGLLAVVTSRRAVQNPLGERRQAHPAILSPWRLAPLAVGVLLLAGVLAGSRRSGGGPHVAAIYIGGALSAGIGALLSTPWITSRLAHFSAGRVHSLSLQLSLRRLEVEPSSSLRVVAALMVLVFAACIANGVARDARAAALPITATQQYQLSAGDLPEAARLQLLSPTHRPGGVAVVDPAQQADPTHPGPPPVSVAFGTCGGLATLLGRPLPGCNGATGMRISYSNDNSTDVPSDESVRLGSLPSAEFTITTPRPVLTLPSADQDQLAGLQVLLPLSQLPHGTIPSSATLLLASPNTTAAMDNVSSLVMHLSPAAAINYPREDFAAAATTDLFVGYVKLGLLLGLLLGLAGFVITSVDRASERRSNIAALAVVGVPPHVLRTSQAQQVAIPLALGATLALVIGLLAEQAYLLGGGLDTSWSWKSLAIGALAAVVAVALAAVGSLLGIQSHQSVGMLRRD